MLLLCNHVIATDSIGPVCVVSVAGPYRKGKSHILSEAFNQPEVFPLGHEMVAETMGIWLWIVPEQYKVFLYLKKNSYSKVFCDGFGSDVELFMCQTNA